jgi:transcription-repair coupling factor (superfamily II helicase)
VVVCPTGTEAEQIADDLAAFMSPERIARFPAWETLPFERVSPNVQTMGTRLETLWRLGSDDPPAVVVTSSRALIQRLAPGALATAPIQVRAGSRIDIDDLCAELVRTGYRREPVVEHRGEFARRGAIVDVWPSTDLDPVRIDTWGDEVDRLGAFNPLDQRSTGEIVALARIFPARELLLDDDTARRALDLVAREPWGREQWERLAEGQIFDGMESWMPWLTDDTVTLVDAVGDSAFIAVVDPRGVLERARQAVDDEADLAATLAKTWDRGDDGEMPRLYADPESLLGNGGTVVNIVPPAEMLDGPSVAASGWAPFVHGPEPLAARISELVAEKWCVAVAADTDESADRITETLRAAGAPVNRAAQADGPGAWVVRAPQHSGWSVPAVRCAVLCESDLSGRRRTRRGKGRRAGSSTTVFEDLKPGGYVVHAHHGVGRYVGMVTRALDGVERDYLLVEYKGGDRLYVPVDQIGTIRQYVGGETPTLHRMGGADFSRTKSKVRSAVREVAQELVVLYQRRVNAVGHAFAPDTPWQGEMEQAFPFVETPDQLSAIAAVKDDMERPVPMDRLVCGDVGFGKTEVAVRAAFKAIQDGRQVAVLVPTTLLASQHAATFGERFAGYPVRVEVLSRFVSTAQAKRVVAGLASGEIDCVIGTHRLLSEGITFKNLGLLVIDEEQRFGVQHKEAIKRFRHDVDVLTMSATPIPRTLEMSLVGIRDLSLLQTPPADRQPILTYVGEESDRVAIEAIRRELLREGQVFWVHNRVQSIEERAAELRRLVPEARIAVAHGQMDETQLEQVVLDFAEHEFDVLVCTTIIESGIDMPSVNTLVVERADLLGLGQMHQLRGRVGRSGRRAYAYLFHPADRSVGEEAHERLRAIGEATDLGSGFKIAMRDLEIRGAGNLLGEAQSGHIAAVGYDLYCQLVTEAVAEMKGETPPAEPVEIRIDLPADAHLPTDYVPTEDLRLEAYRRLAAATSVADVDDIEREWRDRYGPLPTPAENLAAIARLRATCASLGIDDISALRGQVTVSPVRLAASQTLRLRRIAPRATWNESHQKLVFPLARGVDAVAAVTELLDELWSDD